MANQNLSDNHLPCKNNQKLLQNLLSSQDSSTSVVNDIEKYSKFNEDNDQQSSSIDNIIETQNDNIGQKRESKNIKLTSYIIQTPIKKLAINQINASQDSDIKNSASAQQHQQQDFKSDNMQQDNSESHNYNNQNNQIVNCKISLEKQQKQQHKSALRIFLMLLNSVLGCYYWGYMNTVFNTIADDYRIQNGYADIPEHEFALYKGLTFSSIQFGGVIGSFLAGELAGKFGRKTCLLYTDLYCLLGVGLTLISGFPYLIIGHFLCGIGSAMNSIIVPIYINEMSPSYMIGRFGALIQTSNNLGILSTGIFGLLTPSSSQVTYDKNNQFWRMMFAYVAVFLVLRFIFFATIFKFETPYYLVLKQKQEQAKKVLQYIYKAQFIGQMVEQIEQSIKISSKSLVSYKSLIFDEEYKWRTLAAVILAITLQLGGANAVLFYSMDIFEETGSEQDAKIFSFICGIVLVITAWASGFLIDKFSRRKLHLFFQVLQILCLLIFVICDTKTQAFLAHRNIFQQCQKYAIVVFVGSWGFTPSILFVYCAEILPDRGMSLCLSLVWGAGVVLAQLFPLFKTWFGLQITFSVFLGINCALSSLMYIFMLETKGMSHQEIVFLFMRKNKQQADKSEQVLEQEEVQDYYIKGDNDTQ